MDFEKCHCLGGFWQTVMCSTNQLAIGLFCNRCEETINTNEQALINTPLDECLYF